MFEKDMSVHFFSPLSDYTFHISNKGINIIITWNQDGTFNVTESSSKDQLLFENLSETHQKIQELKQTTEFQQAIKDIELYEQTMRDHMKVKHVKVEGKIDHNTFVLSFQLKSSVLAKTTVSINETDENQHYTYVPLRSILYFAIVREGNTFLPTNSIKIVKPPLSMNSSFAYTFHLENFQHYKNFERSFFTHRSFLEDLCSLLVKDPRARVKLLVN